MKENSLQLLHEHFRKYHGSALPDPFLIKKDREAYLGNNPPEATLAIGGGGDQITEWSSELAKHLVKKEEPLQFFCQLCNKKFRRKEELISHYQHHQQTQVK